MSRRPKKSEHIDSPADAADYAALKLNVVLTLIEGLKNQPSRVSADNDDGGFGLATVEDLVRSIRDDLRQSCNADQAAHTLASETAGGAR